MPPRLSIIVPVYNVEPYICKCLDSLVNQTVKDIEIICIDDGSSDGSGIICDKYAKSVQNMDFKVIHKKNEGVVKARNVGMEIATGKYLTFVDSDDWLDIDYYERMFVALGDNDIDVFCSGGRYIEKNGNTKTDKTLEAPFFYQRGEKRAEMLARILVRWPTGRKNEFLCDLGYVWDKIYDTTFMKEKVLGHNNYLDYALWEDTLFELDIFSTADTIGGCLEVGYHYRRDIPDSALTKYRDNLPEICSHWAKDAYKFLERDPAFKEISLQEAFFARCQSMLISVSQYFMHPDNKTSYHEKARKYRDLKNNRYFKERT